MRSIELTELDQQQFLRESVTLGKTLMSLSQARMWGTGKCGAPTSIHHIVRFESTSAGHPFGKRGRSPMRIRRGPGLPNAADRRAEERPVLITHGND